MPDILIREFEMPETCGQCPIFNFDYNICNILSTHHHEYETSRIYGCPLHELPEHGDMIDRDAFDANARKRYCSACDNYNGTKCRACWVDDMLGDVADFETVIPSNKEESNGMART